MSRTVKHRNKDGSQTDYVKYMIGNPNVTDTDDMQRLVKYYQYHNGEIRAPKYYRKQINNGYKRKDKQSLNYALKMDKLDDQVSYKWIKNAGYSYF